MNVSHTHTVTYTTENQAIEAVRAASNEVEVLTILLTSNPTWEVLWDYALASWPAVGDVPHTTEQVEIDADAFLDNVLVEDPDVEYEVRNADWLAIQFTLGRGWDVHVDACKHSIGYTMPMDVEDVVAVTCPS